MIPYPVTKPLTLLQTIFERFALNRFVKKKVRFNSEKVGLSYEKVSLFRKQSKGTGRLSVS